MHSEHFRKFGLLPVLLILSIVQSYGQQRSNNYEKYIHKYKSVAIEQQKKYKIPASITLAQGLLESGAGTGRLAQEANNHFGIKCHEWSGKKIFHNDDALNECFRKYSDAHDSYEDHSLFLVGRDRYASLFRLSSTDYKNWAKGLQRCGYATDRAYANKLIKIIEDYELYQYDNVKFVRPSSDKSFPAWYKPHNVYVSNGLLYIIANQYDTFDLISNELGFSTRKLRKYNEIPKSYPLTKGDVVYLESKNSKVPKDADRFHTVDVGESMHTISQLHGIKVKNLYKMNNKKEDYIPQEGDILRLR
ncbi:MAG: glucosaminidase domain-containing protein [Bacteroidales bacterium]|nr:glucosaminidase domain-containing protein [Bacteroidales bacterium]